MEAFQNTPIGYEAWSRSNTPISTSPDNSAESSMHDRDAMLLIIASLIQENQSIKSENTLLKAQLKMQLGNPSKEEKQAFSSSSKEHTKRVKSRKERSHVKKNLQKCRFCGTVHIWGKFRCPNYKKELDKTSSLNTPETITSASSRSDELSDNLENMEFPEVHVDYISLILN